MAQLRPEGCGVVRGFFLFLFYFCFRQRERHAKRHRERKAYGEVKEVKEI